MEGCGFSLATPSQRGAQRHELRAAKVHRSRPALAHAGGLCLAPVGGGHLGCLGMSSRQTVKRQDMAATRAQGEARVGEGTLWGVSVSLGIVGGTLCHKGVS